MKYWKLSNRHCPSCGKLAHKKKGEIEWELEELEYHPDYVCTHCETKFQCDDGNKILRTKFNADREMFEKLLKKKDERATNR